MSAPFFISPLARISLRTADPRGTAIAAVERRAAALDPLNLIRLTPA